MLQGWVDGTQAFNRTDIAFRRADEGWIKIKSFRFDVYFGGEASPVRDEIHFDSLAFGPERVGCDDSEGFDPPFRDDDNSVFAADITWLSNNNITQGVQPSAERSVLPRHTRNPR